MLRWVLVPVFLTLLFLAAAGVLRPSEIEWNFAVSGDSRNCGDIILPTIAKSVLAHNARFYWHLGDFRIGYAEDEDMKQSDGVMSIDEYHKRAWDDFLEHQIEPFGSLTVHLGIGNHVVWNDKQR